MDPTLIPELAAIVSAIVGGAAGEAGRGAWGSLTALVRRRFGAESAVTAAVEQAESRSPAETARVLAEHAQADPGFHRPLTDWVADTSRLLQIKHDVTNTISGNAYVSGPVVQAGDVAGSINIGDPQRRP